MLNEKKEFLYELDGKNYIIGACECVECDDQQLINDYKDFIRIVKNERLMEYDKHEIVPRVRDKVAEAFYKVFKKCQVPIEESDLTSEKKYLRMELEEKYAESIEEQMKIWTRANSCYDDYIIAKENEEK